MGTPQLGAGTARGTLGPAPVSCWRNLGLTVPRVYLSIHVVGAVKTIEGSSVGASAHLRPPVVLDDLTHPFLPHDGQTGCHRVEGNRLRRPGTNVPANVAIGD